MTERDPKQRDLVGLLREADAELAEQPLSGEADARLRRLVRGEEPRRSVAPTLVLAPLAAAAVALLVWALLPGEETTPKTAPARDRLGGFTVVAGAARARQKRVSCASDACTLAARDQGTRLELTRGAVVRRRGKHLQVVRGQATLNVTPRPRGRQALRVLVSHGHIEVLGTVFTVRQREAGGQVTLRRGAIRFVGTGGQTRDVSPGQTLTWPLQPEPVAVKEPKPAARKRPTPRKRAPKKLTIEETESLTTKVARLRSQRRFAEAARQLRAALPRIPSRATRVTLSYELGELLTHDLADRAAACRHWRSHLRRYGPGRYGGEIRQARKKAGCADVNRK